MIPAYLDQLAARYGVTPQQIGYALRKAGVKSRREKIAGRSRVVYDRDAAKAALDAAMVGVVGKPGRRPGPTGKGGAT